jgi:tripartite-type tricarboxylate transporter receptor subunit TctC
MTMAKFFKQLLCAVFGALLLSTALPSLAQDNFPSKPIKWIVPYPPGGIPDRLARAYASRLAQAWGQPVVVENKPGANSLIGGRALGEEPADGYTMLMITSVVAVGRALYPASSWPAHPLDVFAPVSSMIKLTNVVVVPAASPYKTMADLIAASKAAKDPVQYGIPSLGSSVHLGMELFAERSAMKVAGVPYKGGPDLATNLVGGHIGLAADNLTNSLPYIRAGKLRALMVMSPQRNAVIPDVPSTTDAGYGDFESSSWQGVAVKVGTPKPIVDKISREIGRISKMPEVRKLFEEQGDMVVSSTPEEFAALIQRESSTMTAVIKRLNITSQ